MALTDIIFQRTPSARFVVFLMVLAGCVGLASFVSPWWLSVMLGFDLAALLFILSCVPLYRGGQSPVRNPGTELHGSRALMAFVVFTLTFVVLVAVASQMLRPGRMGPGDVAVAVGTLILAWLFGNVFYALHYFDLFYSSYDGRAKQQELEFSGDQPPRFSDFVYFSFCFGTALASSDTKLASTRMRRVALGHTILAYVYSVGILALAINILASPS